MPLRRNTPSRRRPRPWSTEPSPATARFRTLQCSIQVVKKLLLGLLLGGLLLILLLRRVELSALTVALVQVDVVLLIPVLACKATAIALRARRWAVAIEGGTGVRPRKRVLAASLIGFAGNLVLPARLGEIARATVLRKHNDVPMGVSLTSVGITQLLDLLVLASLLVWLAFRGAGAPLIDRRALGLLFGLLAAAVATLIACVRHEDQLRGLLSRLFRAAPAALGQRLERLFENFNKALRVIKAPSHLAAVLAYTLLLWLLEIVAYGSALAAFQIAPTPAMTILIMVALNLSLAFTITPGNLGAHQLVSVLVLSLFAVPETEALAFSIGLQGIAQTAIFVLGGVLFYREGLSLDLLNRGR